MIDLRMYKLLLDRYVDMIKWRDMLLRSWLYVITVNDMILWLWLWENSVGWYGSVVRYEYELMM